MSCPDWTTLARRRDRNAESELLWDRALAHLDGCQSCREAACAAEPALVFRRLPAPEPTREDIDAMKQAVHAMRRAQPLVKPESATRRRFGASPRSLRWMRLAASVLVVAGAVALYGEWGPGNADPPAALGPRADLLEVGETSPRNLRFEIQVLKASKEEPPHSALEDAKLLRELRAKLNYENYQVLARTSVPSGEGEDVISSLGNGYEVAFKAGSVFEAEGDADRVQLEDFRIQHRTTVKGRQTAPQKLIDMPLDLTIDRLRAVAFLEDREEPLVVAILCSSDTASSGR